MHKYADLLKQADPAGKGINSSWYKVTGVDPALYGRVLQKPGERERQIEDAKRRYYYRTFNEPAARWYRRNIDSTIFNKAFWKNMADINNYGSDKAKSRSNVVTQGLQNGYDMLGSGVAGLEGAGTALAKFIAKVPTAAYRGVKSFTKHVDKPGWEDSYDSALDKADAFVRRHAGLPGMDEKLSGQSYDFGPWAQYLAGIGLGFRDAAYAVPGRADAELLGGAAIGSERADHVMHDGQ